MAFQVGAFKSQLTGPPPVPTNIYTLQLVGFRPKVAAKGDSLNYNAEFKILDDPQYNDSKVFFSLNTKFFVATRDWVHATGNECEISQMLNPETGVVEDFETMPGFFEDADKFPEDPTKWGAYRGPLTNATFKAEVILTSYQGKPKNEIRQFFCAVPDCATKYPDMKHLTNLIKS